MKRDETTKERRERVNREAMDHAYGVRWVRVYCVPCARTSNVYAGNVGSPMPELRCPTCDGTNVVRNR